MVKKYVPKQGDIVHLNFNPQRGREQAGKRPALVISPELYNETGLALFCPITSQMKGYPFEVFLEEGMKTKGVILSDHVRSIDWQERGVKFIEKIPKKAFFEVQAKLEALIK